MNQMPALAQLAFQSSLTILAIVAGWFFAVYGQIRTKDSDYDKRQLYPLFRSVGIILLLIGGLALVSWFALLGYEFCLMAVKVILPAGCALLMVVAAALLLRTR
jgi:hypothetical protein